MTTSDSQPSNSFDPIRWKTSSTCLGSDKMTLPYRQLAVQQMKPSFVFALSLTCGHPLVPHQCEPLTKGCPGPQPTCRRLKPLYLLGSPREAERVTLLLQPPTTHFFTFFPPYMPKILTSEAPPTSRAYIITNTCDRRQC